MTETAHNDLQTDLARRLYEDGRFGDMPSQCSVLTQDSGDLYARIQESLLKIGVLALVVVPVLNCTVSSARPPIYDQVRIRVEIYENGLINRSASGSGHTALTLAEAAAAVLHGWAPPGRGAELYLDPAGSITPEPHPELTIYHVNLKLGKR